MKRTVGIILCILMFSIVNAKELFVRSDWATHELNRPVKEMITIIEMADYRIKIVSYYNQVGFLVMDQTELEMQSMPNDNIFVHNYVMPYRGNERTVYQMQGSLTWQSLLQNWQAGTIAVSQDVWIDENLMKRTAEHRVAVFQYDAKGRLIRSNDAQYIYVDSEKALAELQLDQKNAVIYFTEAYDHFGNWTKRRLISNDGTAQTMTRIIKYYD